VDEPTLVKGPPGSAPTIQVTDGLTQNLLRELVRQGNFVRNGSGRITYKQQLVESLRARRADTGASLGELIDTEEGRALCELQGLADDAPRKQRKTALHSAIR
ncbi:MAG TPA: hypothetical protein VNL71_08710, partial [Chloroflexota bacterium]|nr:hypothetical protein [Chloroflexota bacterium]